MTRPLKNKKGSAIVWALLVLAMLSVLIAAALTISFSYLKRSRVGVDAQQCYFTARSVAESVAKKIVKEPGCGLLPDPGDPDIVDSGVGTSFLAAKMGECTVTIKRTGESAASVTADVTRRDSSYSYTVMLSQDIIVVPLFEGGLYLNQISDENNRSPFASVTHDVYIAGNGVNYIDFTVNGNIFAPNATVIITAEGGVGGGVFAKSVKFNSRGGDQFVPTLCVTPDTDTQEGLSSDITEQHFLSQVDFDRVILTASIPPASPYVKDAPTVPAVVAGLDPGEYHIRLWNKKNGNNGHPEGLTVVEAPPSISNIIQTDSAVLNSDGEYRLTSEYPDGHGHNKKTLFYFLNDNATIDSFTLQGAHIQTEIYIPDGKTLTLKENAAMTTADVNIFGMNCVLKLDANYPNVTINNTISVFNVLNQIKGPAGAITVERGESKTSELVDVGWEIVGSEEA